MTNIRSKILDISCENCTIHRHISVFGRQNGCLMDNKTLYIRGSFKMFPNHFISEKYEAYNYVSYISFKIDSWCKYTLLPVTAKLFETFLRTIF